VLSGQGGEDKPLQAWAAGLLPVHGSDRWFGVPSLYGSVWRSRAVYWAHGRAQPAAWAV